MSPPSPAAPIASPSVTSPLPIVSPEPAASPVGSVDPPSLDINIPGPPLALPNIDDRFASLLPFPDFDFNSYEYDVNFDLTPDIEQARIQGLADAYVPPTQDEEFNTAFRIDTPDASSEGVMPQPESQAAPILPDSQDLVGATSTPPTAAQQTTFALQPTVQEDLAPMQVAEGPIPSEGSVLGDGKLLLLVVFDTSAHSHTQMSFKHKERRSMRSTLNRWKELNSPRVYRF